MHSPPDRFSGLAIDVAGLGKVELGDVLSQGTETSVYRTTHAGVAAKIFDLYCDKPGEVSYGPYLGFNLEMSNFEDILPFEDLRLSLPAYYGGKIDYERKYAVIAMEFLHGQDLKSWAAEAARTGFEGGWVNEFRQAMHETLSIMTRFHRHGIVVIDFKPANVIRLDERVIKFVDLGAFLTPRHHREPEKYLYSATPDYAELVIDASNIQGGDPPTETSDIFSAGVALFELATGNSRLAISSEAADAILAQPSIYRFRDSQIRDLLHGFPHLKDQLPQVERQLRERRILFSELWHLLKGFLASQMADWEDLPVEQRDQILLETGTTFIREQLPAPLQWLAEPIARATVLRGLRTHSVRELMVLMADPAGAEVREDLEAHNGLVQYLRDADPGSELVSRLNGWDTRCQPDTGRWAIGAQAAWSQLADTSRFIFLRQVGAEETGHRYYEVATDMDADDVEDGKLTLWHLQQDHFAWIGAAG